jgi:hypothetical protein
MRARVCSTGIFPYRERSRYMEFEQPKVRGRCNVHCSNPAPIPESLERA